MKKILLVLSLVMIGALSATAGGTEAGTSIDNIATLKFSVGGNSQTPQDSNNDNFVVDKKIDFVVANTEINIVPTNPNATEQNLTFTVTNQGNAIQDFHLYIIADNGNPYANKDDDANVTFRYFKLTGGAEITYLDEVAIDGVVTVKAVFDIPSDVVDGNISEYTLRAEARVGNNGTTGSEGAVEEQNTTADNQAQVDVVFADGAGTSGDIARDGNHSANSAFEIQSAVISFYKWSIVISDPVNTTNPKRIPGAVIRYCFDINNTGTKDATGVYLTENFGDATKDNTLDYNSSIIEENSHDQANGCDCAGLSTGKSGTSGNGKKDIRIPADTVDDRTIKSNEQICAMIEATVK